MNKRLLSCFATSMLLAASVFAPLTAVGKSDSGGSYTAADKEFYLDETQVAFIRPGLELEILDVVIPSDLKPEVTFMVTDPAGLPLDRAGIFTPGPVSTSFILSYIPEEGKGYLAYTKRVQTSPITGNSAEQASTDSGGSYTDLGDGVYLYKFGTTLPADYDADATHTLGMYATRNLAEFDLDTYVDNALYHFVPSGGAAPMPREIVTTATCNRCHDPLALHGGSRQEVGLCIQCHNPYQNIDPDTGSSIFMPNMVHKIHMGENLANGYTVIGYRQGVHDYSDVVFPIAPNDCEACHTGGTPTADIPFVANPNPAMVCDGKTRGMTELTWADVGAVEIRLDAPDGKLFTMGNGAGSKETGEWVMDGQKFLLLDRPTGQVLAESDVDLTVFGCVGNAPGTFRGEAATNHTAWLTNPNRVACGACHDDVNFATGENHAGGAWDDDEFCAFCHEADSGVEFDRSIRGAHTVVYKSNQLPGLVAQIQEVRNTGPGQSPTVIFSLFSKKGRVNPASLNRILFTLTGPNEDFDFYAQENALGRLMPAGNNWSFTFNAALPNNAAGSFSVGVEGRISNVPLSDGSTATDQMQNYIFPIAVTDAAPMARRLVVDDAKCESCHANLSLHGGNRHNAGEYCQTCHRPDATDDVVRLEGLDESIHFKYMVHKIHRGAALENGFVVYGYRSSVHDYSHVVFPGDLRNCEACHVEGAYGLPTPAGALPTNSPNTLLTTMGADTASCLSCHDSLEAAAHADANTSPLGESCGACHGEDRSHAVDKVHAR
jgi:hypothetical protein